MRQRQSGVVYVAIGRKARLEANKSWDSMREHNSYSVSTISDKKGYPGRVSYSLGVFEDRKASVAARWAKVCTYMWSPYYYTLLLDADTRIHGSLGLGFKALEEGWDMAIVPSYPSSPTAVLWNLTQEEAQFTTEFLYNPKPLMLNSGVMFFSKNQRVERFFEAWRLEWLRFQDKDQGALLRALDHCPVSILLLGRSFNQGGSMDKHRVVEHLFGRAE